MCRMIQLSPRGEAARWMAGKRFASRRPIAPRKSYIWDQRLLSESASSSERRISSKAGLLGAAAMPHAPVSPRRVAERVGGPRETPQRQDEGTSARSSRQTQDAIS